MWKIVAVGTHLDGPANLPESANRMVEESLTILWIPWEQHFIASETRTASASQHKA
jgi:hypothetical protein